jgi:RNA polymerase sigma-70 factor (ECF subfamily)
VDSQGNLVTLEQQDRALWHWRQIEEALPLVRQAIRKGAGPYSIQAAIAAAHSEAPSAEQTNWPRIALLYGSLERISPSPIILLNRAVAVAMAEGPERGLTLIDSSSLSDDLKSYHLLHAVRADLLRRLGRAEQAIASYRDALALVTNESERRFLENRIEEVLSSGAGTCATSPAPRRPLPTTSRA